MEVATDSPARFGDEQLSLILFEANGASAAALQRALQRIRHILRGTDIVLVYEHICAVVLPATPMAGARIVAHRLAMQLVEVEYSTQMLYGATAHATLQRLRTLRAIEIRMEVSPVEVIDGLFPCDMPVSFPALPPAHCAIRTDEDMQPANPATFAPRRNTKRRKRALFGESTHMFAQNEGPQADESTFASLPHLAFLASYPPLRLFQTFPYALARQYQCVPVGTERGVLTLATCQQLEPAVIAYLQEVTHRAIFQVSCEMSLIEDILRYWEHSLPVTVTAVMTR